MKILLVGGTWSPELNKDKKTYGQPSRLVQSVHNSLRDRHEVTTYNGGNYIQLEYILNSAPQYDVVFWWPNVVDNTLPKIRDVKAVAPKVMLVTSKRNDNNKYDFMQLAQHALGVKANMAFEFSKTDEKKFKIKVFDPLGCVWYEGYDMGVAVDKAMERIQFLRTMSRQPTLHSAITKEDVFKAVMGQDYELCKSDRTVDIPQEQQFINIVRKHAETFYQIFNPGKDVKRFLGNASMRPDIHSTRCMRGMPSFKADGYIFMSQRNVDKQFIDIDHFVPCYMEDGKIYYCGDNKPSVDTPIQMRLYQELPHIKYIIHSHCYIDDSCIASVHTTSKPVPCGAIEEVDEIMEAVKRTDEEFNAVLEYWMKAHGKEKPEGQRAPVYRINLKGHGSIVMSESLDGLENVQYVSRNLPEIMY